MTVIPRVPVVYTAAVLVSGAAAAVRLLLLLLLLQEENKVTLRANIVPISRKKTGFQVYVLATQIILVTAAQQTCY